MIGKLYEWHRNQAVRAVPEEVGVAIGMGIDCMDVLRMREGMLFTVREMAGMDDQLVVLNWDGRHTYELIL